MIRNGHAGFGRGVSEKDRKAPRRGPTSADPTGEKARAVKARYVGVCRGCGAYTQPRNGKGDAYAYCKTCHPGAIERKWTRELVISAMLEWRERYGRLPSSYDWSRTHARSARRAGAATAGRRAAGPRPAWSAPCSERGLSRVRRPLETSPGEAKPRWAVRSWFPNYLTSVRARPEESVGAVAAADRLDRPVLPRPAVGCGRPGERRAVRPRR